MATTIGALRVELSANIAKFERDMGKAAKQLGRVQRNFERFGTRASAAGRSLSIGLTAPLVAVGALAAKSFLSFEQGMNKVAAVSGATEAEMAELTAIAKDLGATTSFSAAQAAEGLGFLAQAGFDATEAGRALPGVLQLAAAGGIQLAEAADIATNVLAGYGLEVDQLARVNDVLAKASSSANTDVLQLGQAFKFAGPVASSAGVSFETSGAAMALMGNAGIQAEMAGTALRGAITKLVNPSGEAAAAIAELEISVTDATGRLLPFDQIIEQLEPHADKTGKIMQIFGQRAGPAMSALISQGADALREMTTALEQSGGTAQEIADKKLAGLTGAWTKLKSATEGVLIEIGDRLSPVLERLAAILTDRILPAVRGALDAFDRLSPGIKTAAVVGAGFAVALGPVLIATGGIVSVLTPLLPILAKSALLMKLGAVAVGVLKTAFAVLTGPIGLTAAALGVLLVSTKTGRNVLALLGRAITNLATGAFDLLRGALAWVVDGLGSLWAWLRKNHPMVKALTAVFSKFSGAVQGLRDSQAVSDLDQEMQDLGASSELTKEAMDRIARQAIELRKKGETLTVGLARVVDHFEQTTLKAERLQEVLEAVAQSTSLAGLSNQARELAKSGESSSDVMRAVAKRAQELKAEGGKLTDVLQNIVRAYGDIETTGGPAGATTQELSDEVQTLVDRLRGTGAIQAAEQWAAALDHIGGLTTLTDDDTQALNQALDTALEKYRALGEEAPAHLQQLRDESRRLFEETTTAARLRPLGAITASGPSMRGLDQERRALQEAALLGPIGIPTTLLDPEITPRFRTKIESAFTGFGAEIGQTFARALEGGGGFLGAIQSLGVQTGNRLGTFLSEGLGKRMTAGTGVLAKGLGSVLGKAAGMAIPLIGPVIGSLIGKLFSIGGPSEAELAGRKTAGAFRDGVIATLNDGQLAEAAEAALGHWRGNEQGAQFLIGVRDAYLAVGKSAADAEAMVNRLWEAEARGPEAVKAVQREMQVVLDQAAELTARHRTIIQGLEGIRDAGPAAFDPAQLDPYLAQMQEAGLLTAAQAAEMRHLADDAHTDWQAMEEAARTYGVAMKTVVDEAGNETQVLDESLLGLGHAQAKLTDEAGRLAAAWDLLTGEGARTGAAIRGMTDEAQGFVTQALEMGIALPAAMQPMIEKMIEQRRLTDQNGEKLTDMSQLQFAAPLTSGFDLLADKIQMLIIALGGPSGLSKAVEEMVASAGLQTTELAGEWAAMTTDMKAQFGSFEAFVEFRAMVARAGVSFDTMQSRWAAMTDKQQQRYGTFEAYVRNQVLRKMAREAGLTWTTMRTDWDAMTAAQQKRYGTFEAFVREKVLRKMAREAGLRWKDMRAEWKNMTADQKEQFGDFETFVQSKLDAIKQRDDVTASVEVTYDNPGFTVDDQDMTVRVRYDDPGWTPPRGAVSAQHGTPFRQFGRGTPAMLHGFERVMTGMEGRGIAAALERIQQGLGAIANLSGVRALAKGGWVTRPTVALLGEREPEAVIPQSQIGRLGTSVQVHVDARGALFTNEYTSQRELARIISDVIVSDLEGTRRLGLH